MGNTQILAACPKLSFFPFHGIFCGLKPCVASRESCRRAPPLQVLAHFITNIILLITYLPWAFQKYQMLLRKHHRYLERLSRTLLPPLSPSPPSREPSSAHRRCPSLRDSAALEPRCKEELLGVTQSRSDATRSKKLLKW